MIKHTKKAILALGSNMGNRRENLVAAVAGIEDFCLVVSRSKIYETPPDGFENQRDFFNAALEVETECDPHELLRLCKRIEEKMGRTTSFKNAPRPIDVDLIFYEDFFSDEDDLRVPHPRWSERDFVKTPLLDLLDGGAFEDEFFADVKKILNGYGRKFPPSSSL